jgi:dTDP-4-dehydrorhamnose 3,5-epimerase
MKVTKTAIDGILIIEPTVFDDSRGYFMENFHESRYKTVGIQDVFVQDNFSRSYKNVLRGLHFQSTNPQAQIVTLVHGEIFDVVVDIRKQSATFGHWFGTKLSLIGPRQIYMPPGFAHGFFVMSDWADIHYKVSTLYNPKNECGIIWNDPDIGIKWPKACPILSTKDANLKSFKDTLIY